MKLTRATDADNDELIHYFENTVLPGPVDLQVQRRFHFFNQYRIQSDDFVTYTLKNSKNQIEAMVSLVFRKGLIHGEEQTIGYATDLRVSKSRRAILSWAKEFLPALTRERDARDCKYIFSVLAHDQRQAYNAFIRPRSTKRVMPRYHLYRKFQAISLHGLFPLAHRPLPGIEVRPAKESDRAALTQYVTKKRQTRPLSFAISQDHFQTELERWRDLYIENFLLALDANGKIIGCCAPWSSQQTQNIIAKRYRNKARTLQDSLYFLSFFGLAHRLSPVNEPMNFRYLNFLHANNPDIFYSLLYGAFQSVNKNEFLVYPHYEGDLLTTPPAGFIWGRVKCGLYCILGPKEPLPDFLKPSFLNDPTDLELAFL